MKFVQASGYVLLHSNWTCENRKVPKQSDHFAMLKGMKVVR
jgi:hypothetical protein